MPPANEGHHPYSRALHYTQQWQGDIPSFIRMVQLGRRIPIDVRVDFLPRSREGLIPHSRGTFQSVTDE